MSANRTKPNVSRAMKDLAEHYASELDSQIGTLNHFARNPGEIGRAHEFFLRGILARFLPGDIRISSGFVASPNCTSRQQDILIHKRNFSTLFEVGDCTVIDYKSFVGAIEVKTRLDSTKIFGETIKAQAELRRQLRSQGLYAVYAYDGMYAEKALEAFWDFVREDPTKNHDLRPDVVLVQKKYLLQVNRDGSRKSPPFRLWRIDKDVTQGQALLALVASVWQYGQNTVLPWWLSSWNDQLRLATDGSQQVQWPHDLQKSLCQES
ncbi:MAG: DUF6602 domain-containing protein [Phycisphaerae bacterium]